MDGFDDLLAPSRQALDANPFENPFTKRSDSPDPWASYNHDVSTSAFASHDIHADDPTFSGFGSSSSAFDDSHHSQSAFAAPAPTSPGFQPWGDVQGSSSIISPISPQHEHEPEPEPKTPSITSPPESVLRSPGFKESIPDSIDEVATTPTKATHDEPPLTLEPDTPPPATKHVPAPLVPSSPTSTESPVSPTIPATAPATVGHGHTPSLSRPSASSTSPSVQPAYFSPLDQPHTAAVDRSFSGLSLGGETFGGWQGSQSAFVGTTTFDQKHASVDEEEEDDDDDKPILQSANIDERTKAALSPRMSIQAQAAQKPTDTNGIQPVFVITVDDPQRVGDPIRAYTMYTVHTKTTSPLFSRSSFSVLRRYSDFLWLYETLSLNNPGVVVPPTPEKNPSPFGRFDTNFVEQRRLGLEKCVNKISNHPVLQKDLDLKIFLESDSFALDIKHRKAETAQEKGGLMATIGQTIAGPRFYETDEWFDKQKSYLDSLELQLKGLVKSIDAVAKQRVDLSIATGEFSQAIADLSSSDVGQQLSGALAGLAEVEKKAQEMQNTQAQEDVVTIMSTADEYARLINSVRLAFSSRIRIYHAWQAADGNVKRVKQTHEANRAQGRLPPEQLSRSLAYVAEAERRALDAKQEFDHVSKLVKSEVARFEKERIDDFKKALEAFLEGMIERQKELIASWEGLQQILLRRVGGGQQQQSQQQQQGAVLTESATA